MAIGQMINAITGPAPDVLLMTGHERWEVASVTVGVIAMFLSLLVLGPTHGIVGGAVAFAFSLALRQLLSFILSLIAIRRLRAGHAPSVVVG